MVPTLTRVSIGSKIKVNQLNVVFTFRRYYASLLECASIYRPLLNEISHFMATSDWGSFDSLNSLDGIVL